MAERRLSIYSIFIFLLFSIEKGDSEVILDYLLKPRPFLGRCYAGNNQEGVTLRYCKSAFCLLGFYVSPKAPRLNRIEFFSCGTPTKRQTQNFIDTCVNKTKYSLEECKDALGSMTKCLESRSNDHKDAVLQDLWTVCCEGWGCNRPHFSLEHTTTVQKCNVGRKECPVDEEAPSIYEGYPSRQRPILEICSIVLGVSLLFVLLVYTCLYFSILREARNHDSVRKKLKRAYQMSLLFESGKSINFENATSLIFIRNIQRRVVSEAQEQLIVKIIDKQFHRLDLKKERLNQVKRIKWYTKFSRLFPKIMRRLDLYVPTDVELCFKNYRLVHPHVLTIAEKLLIEQREQEQLTMKSMDDYQEDSIRDQTNNSRSHSKSVKIFPSKQILINETVVPNEEIVMIIDGGIITSQETAFSYLPSEEAAEEEEMDSDPEITDEETEDFSMEEMTDGQLFELRNLVRSLADKSDWSTSEDEDEDD